MSEKVKSGSEVPHLPSFEEITGFSEVPEEDIKRIREQYEAPFVLRFVNFVNRLNESPSDEASAIRNRAQVLEAASELDQEPNLMKLLTSYFGEKVFGPLFAAFTEAVPNYQDREVWEYPDVVAIWENEYEPMKQKGAQMLLDVFRRISEETLLQARATVEISREISRPQ